MYVIGGAVRALVNNDGLLFRLIVGCNSNSNSGHDLGRINSAINNQCSLPHQCGQSICITNNETTETVVAFRRARLFLFCSCLVCV
jgi:hypothetical protein